MARQRSLIIAPLSCYLLSLVFRLLSVLSECQWVSSVDCVPWKERPTVTGAPVVTAAVMMMTPLPKRCLTMKERSNYLSRYHTHMVIFLSSCFCCLHIALCRWFVLLTHGNLHNSCKSWFFFINYYSRPASGRNQASYAPLLHTLPRRYVPPVGGCILTLPSSELAWTLEEWDGGLQEPAALPGPSVVVLLLQLPLSSALSSSCSCFLVRTLFKTARWRLESSRRRTTEREMSRLVAESFRICKTLCWVCHKEKPSQTTA